MRSTRRGIVAIVVFVSGHIARLQTVGLDVAQDAWPELDAVAERKCIRVRGTFVGAREYVQAAENYFRAAGAIPVRQFEGAPRKGQVHCDANHLRHGMEWWATVEQILVPVLHAPMLGSRGGKAGEGQRGREHVLAETCVRIFGIEGIDQQRVVRLNRSAGFARIKRGGSGHLAGNPALAEGAMERLIGGDHRVTLYYKVLHVNINSGSCKQ